jgi:hypothetical protein
MALKQYKIKRIKEAGFKISSLGTNFEACRTNSKGAEEIITGSIAKIYKTIFGYY